jgi:hypothetical protein
MNKLRSAYPPPPPPETPPLHPFSLLTPSDPTDNNVGRGRWEDVLVA